MSYLTERIPYDRKNREMTPGALKKSFASVMESMPRRIDHFSGYLYESSGVLVTARASDEEINALPGLIAKCGGLWNPTRLLEGAHELTDDKRFAISVIGHDPGLTLTPETVDMAFDGALLWGEVFRNRYPEAHWDIGEKPKSMVDYGDPVLAGPYKYLNQFGVRRELFAHVGCILHGRPFKANLTEIMKIRAFNLGLAPDPSRRVMP